MTEAINNKNKITQEQLVQFFSDPYHRQGIALSMWSFNTTKELGPDLAVTMLASYLAKMIYNYTGSTENAEELLRRLNSVMLDIIRGKEESQSVDKISENFN